MVADMQGIKLTYEQAKTSIATPLSSLPAHADVKPGLEALSKVITN
jgi:2-haloacid dehalogenase